MRMRMLAVLSLAWFGLTGLILSQEKPRAGNTTPNAAASTAVAPATTNRTREPFTVLGHVEKRDRVITIKSGPKGMVYSVATKDGKTLFENLSAKELQAKAPELHDLIKTGVAGDASRRFRSRDARLEGMR